MRLYKYKIIYNSGNVSVGWAFSLTKEDLFNKLRRSCTIVVFIKQHTDRERFPIKNFTLLFFRNLYLLIKNKLDLISALEIVSQMFKKNEKKAIIEYILEAIKNGNSFARSISVFTKYFDNLVVKSIEIAEHTATLDNAIFYIVEYLEKKEKMKNKLRSALIYPMILFSIIFLVFLFWIIFIVPNFIALFLDVGIEIPMSTRIVIFLRNFIIYYSWIVIPILIFLVKLANKYRNLKKVWRKIPFFKSTLRDWEAMKFFFSMKIMMKNNINLLTSMRCIENSWISNVVHDIENGNSLFSALTLLGVFYDYELSIIKSGEKSGMLCQSFEMLSEILQQKVENILIRIVNLVQPILTIFIGVLFIMIIYAVFVPLYSNLILDF